MKMEMKYTIEEKAFPFEFSVVMAVYNVEPFLREAIDSLIAQDLGFDKIQLIMVDDGSTDESGSICDEYAQQYPDNVIVVHKENGGVASARNAGVVHATGRFLNFMDSDDYFTKNAFSKVHEFFTKNEEEVDIVTIPLRFFDAEKGEHWQNHKFHRGTRVLDLFWDYQASIMFVNASFFAHRVKDEIFFDKHLVCGEDMKVLLNILIHKMKLGVVTDCRYMYRRRSVGEASLIQSAKKKYGWYFDYFTYLVDWAVDLYQKKFGFLPAFLQYELLADLQWRFRQEYDMTEVLSDEEILAYKKRLFDSLKYFDDRYILEQKMIWHEHMCYMLSKKHECAPTLTERANNVIVNFGNVKLDSFADQFSMIELLRIQEGKLIIEGYTKLFGICADEPLEVFLKVNNELVACQLLDRKNLHEYRFEELIFRGVAFHGELPLNLDIAKYNIEIVVRYKESYVTKRKLRISPMCPVSKEIRSGYYWAAGWKVQIRGDRFEVISCGRKGHVKAEVEYLRELWRNKEFGARKAVAARLMYWGLKGLIRKEIWLISDRSYVAGDNGEAFFAYVQKSVAAPNRKIYFIISKEAKDYERVKVIGPVLPFLSWRHKMASLLASKIISSHADEVVYNPFNQYVKYYRDLAYQADFVFLQHGIIKDDISKWLNRYRTNIRGFITSTTQEYASIINDEYGYSTKHAWLTGLPRFDKLYRAEKKQIVIMPTWRAYLVNANDVTGVRQLKSGFINSTYYKNYQELLNNQKLLDTAKKYGYTFVFVSHPNMSGELEYFSMDASAIHCVENPNYTQIFAESNLLITDYSSVAFDFAYLRKPVIYYQGDHEEFFSGEHTYNQGYFDYMRDGLGEVECDLDNMINRMIEYMENDCALKPEYQARIDFTFPYADQKNCQRVYEKILHMEKD